LEVNQSAPFGAALNSGVTGVNTQVAFSGLTAAYTIYMTLTFSANTAGNWALLAQVIPEYIY
jgi:hypothetical protein